MTGATALIVGGAGFIGCNLAAHLARNGHRVRIYDDLSRDGVDRNLAWLQKTFGPRIEATIADVRDRERIRGAVEGVQVVFHLAAQTAVTTSLVEPIHDFDVNARGTLEVLEAVRKQPRAPAVIFTSTNRVYGYPAADERLLKEGIDERHPLDLRTPYVCSKGCAERYVLDYAQTYGIPATVFRMSTIYGPHQLGTEDQGWVAHFAIRAIDNQPITIYGDGTQVRDILYVDDLLDAFVRAWSRIGAIAGRAYNIGGGPAATITPLELLNALELLRGRRPAVVFEGWRQGDQRNYVSNTSAFAAETGWRPRVHPRAGIEALHGWLLTHRGRYTP